MYRRPLFLFVFLLVGCATFNTRVKQVNYAFAVAQVEVYKGFYDWIESEEGTYTICKPLLDQHTIKSPDGKEEIDPSYTEDMLKKDCAELISKTESRFDRILSLCAMSSEMVEASIMAGQDPTQAFLQLKQFLKELLDFLKNTGYKIDDKLLNLLESL